MLSVNDQIENQKSKIENANEWDQTRHWVESETGMDLAGTRFGRLRDAVAKVLNRQQPESELRGLMVRPDDRARFLEQLTGQLTIGESFFFRNEHHFRVLRERVLPQLIAENAARRELRIWSAGCATGEEPYSLSILLDQLLGNTPGWQVSILGTDLNPEFLRRAREACYRQWSFRQTDIHRNRNYFTEVGETFRLADRVRDVVRFSYLNLVKDMYPSPLTGTVGLDLILFRNVAIYLKPEVTAAILQRFHQALRPGGWLLLGETEVSVAPVGDFEVLRFDHATLYQKKRDQPTRTNGESAAPTLPVLAAVTLPTGFAVPTVPALPEWVPLPNRKSRTAGPRDASVSAMTSPAGQAVSSSATFAASVWERMERAVQTRNFDEAERALDRVAQKQDRAALRLRLVRALLSCAENAAARRLLDLCLQEEPLLIEAQLLKAGFAEESGDLPAAEQACRRALYINPNAPMAHFHLALVLERKGDRNGVARSLKTTWKLIEGQDPHSLVEFGDGVCHGRLREMLSLLMSK